MSALPPKADMETFGYLEGRLGKMIALPSVPAAMIMPSNAGSDNYRDHHMMRMVAFTLPRCATRHKRGIQRYKARAGRQIVTLFEQAA